MCRLFQCGFYSSHIILVSALVLHTANAQTNQKSPFSPAAQNPSSGPSAPRNVQSNARSDGNHENSDNKDIAIVKSPFTPPPSHSARPDKNFRPKNVRAPPRPSNAEVSKPRDSQRPSNESTREQESQRSANDVTTAPKRKVGGAKSTDTPKPVGSPFRPPMQAEWREGERPKPPSRPLQEPALPKSIRPSPPTPKTGGNPGRSHRRGTGQGSQRNQDRDMHESAPGVTQWTRYTPRPKVRSQEEPSDTRTGRCGSSRYSPRTQICCQGLVQRRQGMKPSCCGRQSFDSAYSKCCSGAVSLRTSQQPECP